jgi:G3E family GTPase
MLNGEKQEALAPSRYSETKWFPPSRQIAAADVILLNKVDTADPLVISETQSLIRQINPAAPIHRTIKGEIDLRHIIGISAYKNPPLPNLSPSIPEGNVPKQDDHFHTADCNKHEDDGDRDRSTTTSHSHDATHYELRGISSVQVLCPIPLSQAQIDALDKWIRDALWENRVEGSGLADEGSYEGSCEVQVLRCKGAFRDERNRWYVLQGVRSVYEISELEVRSGTESVDVPDKGKIVLIGKGLNDKVKESLERIFVN